jgi:hypothetical protein
VHCFVQRLFESRPWIEETEAIDNIKMLMNAGARANIKYVSLGSGLGTLFITPGFYIHTLHNIVVSPAILILKIYTDKENSTPHRGVAKLSSNI